jgi:hypothetical protein
MAVHVVEAFPDRFEGEVAAEQLPGKAERIDALRQGSDLGAYRQQSRRTPLSEEHSQILAQRVL